MRINALVTFLDSLVISIVSYGIKIRRKDLQFSTVCALSKRRLICLCEVIVKSTKSIETAES